MKMSEECYLCSKAIKAGIEWNLKCSSCSQVLHYTCGIGYEDPVKAFRASLGKQQQYRCPICIVATSYKLIHLVLDRHQKLSSDPNDGAADVSSLSNVSSISNGSISSTDVNEGNGTGDTETAVIIPDAPPLTPHGSSEPNDIVTGTERGVTQDAPPVLTPQVPVLRLRDNSPTTSATTEYRQVMSSNETRRVKRCKGMLYGLKHIPSSVDTIIILDSNGRSIKADDIDGSSGKVAIKQIGGLCVSATTVALKEVKLTFPNIKNLAFGLGTNDHLHAKQHPGEKTVYIEELNTIARKVFPAAKINFILPFSAIDGLSVDFVKGLGYTIRNSGVGWKVHVTPNMRGKLVSPQNIHLNPEGRKMFTKWLSKVFTSNRVVTPESVSASGSSTVHHSNTRIHNVTVPTNTNSDTVNRSHNQVSNNLSELDGSSNLSIDTLLKDRLLDLLLGQLKSSDYRPLLNRQLPHQQPPWHY